MRIFDDQNFTASLLNRPVREFLKHEWFDEAKEPVCMSQIVMEAQALFLLIMFASQKKKTKNAKDPKLKACLEAVFPKGAGVSEECFLIGQISFIDGGLEPHLPMDDIQCRT